MKRLKDLLARAQAREGKQMAFARSALRWTIVRKYGLHIMVNTILLNVQFGL
jgi:hypothetical protein